jgi:hypothetical protein
MNPEPVNDYLSYQFASQTQINMKILEQGPRGSLFKSRIKNFAGMVRNKIHSDRRNVLILGKLYLTFK